MKEVRKKLIKEGKRENQTRERKRERRPDIMRKEQGKVREKV